MPALRVTDQDVIDRRDDRDFSFPDVTTLADGTLAMTLNLGGGPGRGGIVESIWLATSPDGGLTWTRLRELPGYR